MQAAVCLLLKFCNDTLRPTSIYGLFMPSFSPRLVVPDSKEVELIFAGLGEASTFIALVLLVWLVRRVKQAKQVPRRGSNQLTMKGFSSRRHEN